MSTRYELARLKQDGSLERIFLKHSSTGIHWKVVNELKTSWYEPQAVEYLFSDGGIHAIGPDVVFDTFAEEAEYRAYLTDGKGCLVEYIFLWQVRKAQWSLIFLNGDNWKTHSLECAGLVLSKSMRHGVRVEDPQGPKSNSEAA